MSDQSTTERIAELEKINAALLLALQEFRHAAVFALYHHQGGHSPVGQPIRKLLGIGQFDDIPADTLEAAKAWAIGDIRPTAANAVALSDFDVPMDNALNEAGWQFVGAHQKQFGRNPEAFNYVKPLLKVAIEAWLRHPENPLKAIETRSGARHD